jgi:hypothetical protein
MMLLDIFFAVSQNVVGPWVVRIAQRDRYFSDLFLPGAIPQPAHPVLLPPIFVRVCESQRQPLRFVAFHYTPKMFCGGAEKRSAFRRS